MQGVQTAYDGLYAPMLVPYSVAEPEDEKQYVPSGLEGYADGAYRNRFYSAKLRIEKLDSETHENLLHDGALFMLYRANGTRPPDRYCFMRKIPPSGGSRGILKAMGADTLKV